MTKKEIKTESAHEQIARQINETVVYAQTAQDGGRQGDCTLVNKHKDHKQDYPESIAILAQGNAGSHVAIGRFKFDKEKRKVYTGAGYTTVVHTDEPTSRHGALRLKPYSEYDLRRSRELSIEGFVRQVED